VLVLGAGLLREVLVEGVYGGHVDLLADNDQIGVVMDAVC